MAISQAHPEFTRFVNGVLANERADGTWSDLCQANIASGCPASPPAATYKP